jgi:hypothetical protein
MMIMEIGGYDRSLSIMLLSIYLQKAQMFCRGFFACVFYFVLFLPIYIFFIFFPDTLKWMTYRIPAYPALILPDTYQESIRRLNFIFLKNNYLILPDMYQKSIR